MSAEITPGSYPNNYLDDYLASLETIEGRAAGLRAGKTPETKTELLMADDNELFQKFGTEFVEVLRELIRPDFDAERTIGEAADITYSLEAALATRGISMLSVFRELGERNKAARQEGDIE